MQCNSREALSDLPANRNGATGVSWKRSIDFRSGRNRTRVNNILREPYQSEYRPSHVIRNTGDRAPRAGRNAVCIGVLVRTTGRARNMVSEEFPASKATEPSRHKAVKPVQAAVFRCCSPVHQNSQFAYIRPMPNQHAGYQCLVATNFLMIAWRCAD